MCRSIPNTHRSDWPSCSVMPRLLLLIKPHLAWRWADQPALLICIDDESQFAPFGQDNPSPDATAENLAYVIYTSGSTGTPRGNEHAPSHLQPLALDAAATSSTWIDHVLQKTPFQLRRLGLGVLRPLMTGARLVVARPGGHRDSHYLARIIEREQITTLHFVPSMLRLFLKEPALDGCEHARVVCSGEALPFDIRELFFLPAPDVEIHDLYGPTEAAVDVSFWACRRGEGEWGVPIGGPISNIQLYVLDRGKQPVPIGVTGELYIGGTRLAEGCLEPFPN